MRSKIAAGLLAIVAAPAPALAQVQSPQPPAAPQPAPQPPSISEGTEDHKGVIKPPAGIDPGIHKTVPSPNPDPTGKSVVTPEELPKQQQSPAK